MKVTQHLWFERDMEAAVRFYTDLIADSSIAWTSAVPADNPSGPAGSVGMMAFTLGGQRYMAINGGPLDPFNHSFSIAVECDDQAEIDRLWDALKEGGKTEQCGWLKDRWGLSWQITPKRLLELTSASGDAGKRAFQAMMTMRKIDIAKIEAAAAGEQVDA